MAADPNRTILTGENPFIRLSDTNGGALAEPGQRRRDHRMTDGTKIGSDVPPAPPAEPRTRDEEKRRHDWAQEKTGE